MTSVYDGRVCVEWLGSGVDIDTIESVEAVVSASFLHGSEFSPKPCYYHHLESEYDTVWFNLVPQRKRKEKTPPPQKKG